jgi:DNA-binding response OmpR family regulator
MTQKSKILLIDDEEDILHILRFTLLREGYDVESTMSGPAGLALVMKNKYTAVVCDLNMPELDGLSLIKKVRAGHNLVPFVFLSGHAHGNHEREMINYGAYELVMKPNLDRIPEVLRVLNKAGRELDDLAKKGGDAMEFLELINDADKKVG